MNDLIVIIIFIQQFENIGDNTEKLYWNLSKKVNLLIFQFLLLMEELQQCNEESVMWMFHSGEKFQHNHSCNTVISINETYVSECMI